MPDLRLKTAKISGPDHPGSTWNPDTFTRPLSLYVAFIEMKPMASGGTVTTSSVKRKAN
jgi:hypothetical protein